MNLTESQKKKLLRAAKIADEGGVAVAEELFSLEEKIDKAVEEIKATVPDVKSLLEQVKGKDGADSVTPGPQGVQGLTGATGPAGRDGKDGKDGADGKGIDGKNGKDGRDGVDGKDADETSIIQKLESELPQFGTAFRDGLELLKEEDRLDSSAIKGLDAREAKLSKELTDRAISIVDNRSSYTVQRVQKLEDRKIDGWGVHSIYVQPTQPTNPQEGDLWIDSA